VIRVAKYVGAICTILAAIIAGIIGLYRVSHFIVKAEAAMQNNGKSSAVKIDKLAKEIKKLNNRPPAQPIYIPVYTDMKYKQKKYKRKRNK
jgi:hypothetical protein